MKRALGKFETAAALSGEHAVWNIVGMLHLDGIPSPDNLRAALEILQARHPLLRVRLILEGGRHYFESGDVPAIPMNVHQRRDDDHWVEIVEDYLNFKFEHSQGPLLQCAFLTDGQKKGEVILAAQHSIVDGPSVENLFRELMTLCALIESTADIDSFEPLAPLPPVEESFPSGFQGFDLKRKTLGYFGSQMGDEFAYQMKLRGKRKPPIHLDARGRVLHMRTPEEQTKSIVRRARQQRVTLNSAINAAVLLSVQKHLYAGTEMPFRFMSMADLRPYIEPPAPPDQVACYISPLRYTVQVMTDDTVWPLARRINEQIYASTKRGEKFLASVMGEQFMRMTFGMKKFRMATTALSYGGASKLEPEFGPYKITGVHGFVSNFGLGPEFSGQVSIFNDELWWDMLYLDTDMDREMANQIFDEIHSILVEA
ncbi:MAG: hypothetical protein ISR58_02480 [Anaerolineales bacterium]|nr:hypothetical protein [Chloroflexota bacterium]MBL6980035.1 hypothetical protein [Anaerolineales bacterium]